MKRLLIGILLPPGLLFLAYFLYLRDAPLAIPIILAVVAFYLFIKERLRIFHGEKLTPAILWETRRKMGPNNKAYERAIRRRITEYEALIMEYKEKGIKPRQVWVDNLELLKKELSNISNALPRV